MKLLRRRRRPIPSPWALWLFIAALVLKAAMPLLATGSAEVQGKALVEVCTVYGMSMLSVDRSDKAPGPDAGTAPKPADSIAHLDHHCVLTALAALATADDPAPFPTAAAPRSSTPRPATPAARPGHDAAAAWLAGRKQGPPTVS